MLVKGQENAGRDTPRGVKHLQHKAAQQEAEADSQNDARGAGMKNGWLKTNLPIRVVPVSSICTAATRVG